MLGNRILVPSFLTFLLLHLYSNAAHGVFHYLVLEALTGYLAEVARPAHHYFSWGRFLNILIHIIICFALYLLGSSANKVHLVLQPECGVVFHPETHNREGKAVSSRRARHHSGSNKPSRSPQTPGDAGEGKRRLPKANEDSHRIPKADVKRRGETPADNQLFACPLFKYNPLEHRNCLLKNHLTSISYVVQHLQRPVHQRQPIHCPRCGVQFGTRDECNRHINSPQQCSPQSFHYPGLTEDQLTAIRTRRNAFPDDVSRWFDLWKGMFPNTRPPDSPFVVSEKQELLNVTRRAYIIAKLYAEAGGGQPPDPLALFDWNYVSGLIGSLSFGMVPGDLSFLSSDNRFPEISWTDGGSLSDMLPSWQPQSHQPPPSQSNSINGMEWEQEVNGAPIASSSQMGSNQPPFHNLPESNTHSSSGWVSLYPAFRPNEDPPISEVVSDEHPGDPCLPVWEGDGDPPFDT